MRILLLEENDLYAKDLVEYLNALSYKVDRVDDSEEACKKMDNNNYHLIILDMKLSSSNDYEIISYIRDIDINIPIMIISTADDIDSFKHCYELGCNEYIKKPFDILELKIRLSELMKRYYNISNKNLIIIAKIFNYDPSKGTLFKGLIKINLSRQEVRIIEYLLSKKGYYTSIEELKNYLWNKDVNSADIRVHISNLRQKTSYEFILSLRGFGYKINI